MPLYEYFCPSCSDRFEILRPMSQGDEPALCPAGHATTDRVVSLFAVTKTADGSFAPFAESGGGCACGGACSCGAAQSFN